MQPALYLIPVPIAEGDPRKELAPRILELVATLRDFVVEDVRTARRFLAAAAGQALADEASFAVLDKRSVALDAPALLEPLRRGRSLGLMSEAGSPCVADPGALLVEAASREGFRVAPLPGPSAVLMALMASGLGGQSFAFNGYLPAEAQARARALRELERRSAAEGSTQLFIETPYRNNAMLRGALEALAPATMLCVAYALSSPDEDVKTMSVERWRRLAPGYGKEPAVFLLAAPPAAKPRPRDGTDGRETAGRGPRPRRRLD